LPILEKSYIKIELITCITLDISHAVMKSFDSHF